MAYQNKIISNSKIKQQIRFLQTGGETDGRLLEMEATYYPHSKEPASHYHPNQVEDFIVIAGEMTVKIDRQIKTIKQGDTLHIPKNKVHSMWNSSDSKTVLNWKVSPALNMDHFLETVAGLANEGKTNEDGRPGILQVAMMFSKFSPVFRLAKPPYLFQKVIFSLLMPFAYILGYRKIYKEYLD